MKKFCWERSWVGGMGRVSWLAWVIRGFMRRWEDGWEERGDGGPILLGSRGLSRRIVPWLWFTITCCYTMNNKLYMDG